MNIFFLFRKENRPDSPLELVTAPLDRGDVLPGVDVYLFPVACVNCFAGVTRNSVLSLCRSEWGQKQFGSNLQVSEKWITMGQIQKAAEEGRVGVLVLVCSTSTGCCKQNKAHSIRIYFAQRINKGFCDRCYLVSGSIWGWYCCHRKSGEPHQLLVA